MSYKAVKISDEAQANGTVKAMLDTVAEACRPSGSNGEISNAKHFVTVATPFAVVPAAR